VLFVSGEEAKQKNNPPLLGSGFSVEEEMLGYFVIERAWERKHQGNPRKSGREIHS
jgi:hypothetical protein